MSVCVHLSVCLSVCLCARDCLYVVDFVLVYDEAISAEEKKSESKRKDLERNEKWRQKFMRNLQETGVQCEEVTVIINLYTHIQGGPKTVSHL